MAKNDTDVLDRELSASDAKDDEQQSTPNDDVLVRGANHNIRPYVPTEKAGPYDEDVDTLIAVNAETGTQNLIPILVPRAEFKKHKRQFAAAAKKRGYTARIVNGEDGEPHGSDGQMLEFILSEQVHRRSKEESAAAKTDDVPEQVA